jgi:hypothetical protein
LAIFTKQFANADQYEDWLEAASDRINVLSITNSPPLFAASDHVQSGPVTITYQTTDRSLAPPRSTLSRIVEAVLIGAGFFALFLYLVSKI